MDSLKTLSFPDHLKLEEMTPSHKKQDPFHKDNYRSIRFLPLVSKSYTPKFMAKCTDA